MSDFHDPAEMSLWQQLAHAACLCERKRGYWPPRSLPARALTAAAGVVEWLQWLASGYDRGLELFGQWWRHLWQ